MNRITQKLPSIVRWFFVILFLLIGWSSVWADEEDEIPKPTPERTITKTIKIMEHTWWVVQWSDNEILCELTIDHEGLPTGAEI
ncbi:unnamed protein product [marine sediment metagenome]|uniref:Uncharacterized protein n=1 Tax=marine sediment metagenome TaxID=412755 RepID=X0TGA8_9ZZZZ